MSVFPFLLETCALLDSPDISAELYAHIQPRMQYAGHIVSEREPYLARPDVDNDIFGTFWGRQFFDTVAAMIAAADPKMLNRLRLIYNFTGVPITPYRRSETFPIIDPTYQRYLKLRAATPEAFRFVAPTIAGEAGWKLDGGLVNHDVAIMQERIQFLYYSGILEKLTAKPTPPSVLEIGAGGGLFALALSGAFGQRCRYAICDIPEVLCVSFAYLNLTQPERPHYVVLPDGVYDVKAGKRLGSIAEILDKIDDGFVYIPNYVMHDAETFLHCDLVVNAMSLHEMRRKQIEYYCRAISAILKKHDGIFFDINAHAHQENATNDPSLRSNFAYHLPLNLMDISLSGRVWTNDFQALDDVAFTLAENRKRYDLDTLFALEMPYEYPPFSESIAQRVMTEDLGIHIGCDFKAWMEAGGYHVCTPQQGYRFRHGLPELPTPAVKLAS